MLRRTWVLLATMVPLPTLLYNTLALPLQLLASNLATEISRWCGVAVSQDGNVIRLASVSLGVEEACSGLTSLSSLIVASVLLGFLFCERAWARLKGRREFEREQRISPPPAPPPEDYGIVEWDADRWW